MSSPTAEATLREYERLTEWLDRVRLSLQGRLYDAVPKTSDRLARRILLRAQRVLHATQPLADQDVDRLGDLDDELRSETARYNVVLAERDALLERAAPRVVVELRQRLDALLDVPLFHYAVSYSCPQILSHGPRTVQQRHQFSRRDRTLYAYASKFVTKANPFNVFARVAFTPVDSPPLDPTPRDPAPTDVAPPSGDCCELVLDADYIIELEQELLRRMDADAHRYLALRPHLRTDAHYCFFIVNGTESRHLRLRATDLVDTIVAYFRESNAPHTPDACVACVHARCPRFPASAIVAHLARLTELGIVGLYLIPNLHDLRTFCVADNDEASVSAGAALRCIQQNHLAAVAIEELPALDRTIRETCAMRDAAASASAKPSTLRPNQYYVNWYGSERATRDESATLAEEAARWLRPLKPVFALLTNTRERGFVIRAFLADRVAAEAPRDVPYLTLVREFRQHATSLVDTYLARLNAESPMLEAWRRCQEIAGACEHDLDAGTLEHLLACVPSDRRMRPQGERARLCFTGPMDRLSGRFYVHNIFPGGSRLRARYFRHARPVRSTEADDQLDVQLVPPFRSNRNYTAAVYATGCGFDARHRHMFRRWIDPADIILCAGDDGPVYRDRRSGIRLRFHFVGVALAFSLPTEYQLLLSHHVDYYENPFCAEPKAVPDNTRATAEPIFRPGAYVGSVCLRRPELIVPRALCEAACADRNCLTRTLRVRTLVRSSAPYDTNDWYYVAPRAGASGYKPRHLSLDNPLSVELLAHTVAALPPEGRVFFSPMEPTADRQAGPGGGIVTELMIEVS